MLFAVHFKNSLSLRSGKILKLVENIQFKIISPVCVEQANEFYFKGPLSKAS